MLTIILGIVALLEAGYILWLKLHKRPIDGDLNITTGINGTRTFTLEIRDDPEYILDGVDSVLFKVNKRGGNTE